MKRNLMRGALMVFSFGLAVAGPVSAGEPALRETAVPEAATPIATESTAVDPQAAEEKEKEKKPDAPKPPTLTLDKGAPKFTSADGKTFVKLGFRLHQDFRAPESGAYQTNGTHLTSTFFARRVRLGVNAAVGDTYEAEIIADFSSQSRANFKEAYVTVKMSPAVQFTVGQHKVPFGYEWQNQSDNYIDFIERSMTFTSLNPQYDLGITMKGSLFDKKLDYWVGYFNGEGEVQFPDSNDGKEGAGRIRFQAVDGLFLGANATYGMFDAKTTPAGRLATGFIFNAAVPMNGARVRWGADFQYFNGPFAIKAEYNRQSDKRVGLGAGGTNLPDVRSKGFWASATYILTGEKRTQVALDPKSPIDPKKGTGHGAWEIGARFERLELDTDGTFSAAAPLGNRADQYTADLKFYMGYNSRLMLDFTYYKFGDELRTPFSYDPETKRVAAGKTGFWEILSRIQFFF